MIHLFRVAMNPDVMLPLREVLLSGYIGQGAKVDEFEARLSEYLGTPYVVTTNSGTSALHLAYRLAGVGPGTDVVTTPMTCMATNEPILERGGRVVWADVNPATGNIDPDDAYRKITGKTRALVCVHWGGMPCDMAALRAVADDAGVALIEDAAHAFGAEYAGQKIGGMAVNGAGRPQERLSGANGENVAGEHPGALWGDFCAFSFQAIKLLTTGDGGALVCRNAADYKRAKLLRWYGMDREDKTRLEMRCEADVPEAGYKFHMNDINATIGLANLPRVPALLERTRLNAAYYDGEFRSRNLSHVTRTARDMDRRSSFWLYTFMADDPRLFIDLLKSRGVHASQVHVRNDIHSCFAVSRTSLPGVDEFTAHQVNIPVGWWVTDEDRETVMAAIQKYDDILGRA